MAQEQASLGRRGFLGVLGLGIVALARPDPLAAASVKSSPDEEERKARYRETEHVKTFYRVNRY
jgi:hypothetical protein